MRGRYDGLPVEVQWISLGKSRLFLRDNVCACRRLADGVRLILFDRRGTGLSDPVSGDDLLRMDDGRAVLDAVESEKPVIFAQGYGCPLAIAFAATYPDRTKALVLYNPVAKAGERDDYPWGSTPAEREAWLAETEGRWGTEEFARHSVRRLARSIADDTRQVSWYARVMRAREARGPRETSAP